jgi:hypothetical protein
MQNLWLEWLIDKFVTEETKIRCCGSCHGGCMNPAVCFLCCNYSVDDLAKYVETKGKDVLWEEFKQHHSDLGL